jgi:hypothetical protein
MLSFYVFDGILTKRWRISKYIFCISSYVQLVLYYVCNKIEIEIYSGDGTKMVDTRRNLMFDGSTVMEQRGGIALYRVFK